MNTNKWEQKKKKQIVTYTVHLSVTTGNMFKIYLETTGVGVGEQKEPTKNLVKTYLTRLRQSVVEYLMTWSG